MFQCLVRVYKGVVVQSPKINEVTLRLITLRHFQAVLRPELNL